MAKKTKFQTSRKKTIRRSELSKAEYNPRKIASENAETLRAGLKQHGFVGGMVYNERTGNLVSGHQRLEQLDFLENGEDYYLEIDCVDIDADQEKELNILLNARSAQGEDDEEALAEIVCELAAKGRNVQATGLDLAMIADLMVSFSLDSDQPTEDIRTLELEERIEEELKEAASPDKGKSKKEKKQPKGKKKEKEAPKAIIISFTFVDETEARKFTDHMGLDPARDLFDWEDVCKGLGIETK